MCLAYAYFPFLSHSMPTCNKRAMIASRVISDFAICNSHCNLVSYESKRLDSISEIRRNKSMSVVITKTNQREGLVR